MLSSVTPAESTSPVYAWIVAYISSRPRLLTSKRIEISVAKDTEAEDENRNGGRYNNNNDDEEDLAHDNDGQSEETVW